jgi:hypothetical protein
METGVPTGNALMMVYWVPGPVLMLTAFPFWLVMYAPPTIGGMGEGVGSTVVRNSLIMYPWRVPIRM